MKNTVKQLEMAYKAAVDGYTKAYGQVHETPAGKFCWMGRIDRATLLAGQAKSDVERKKMEKGVRMLTNLAEKDFVSGELAHADYMEMCQVEGITPNTIDPNCHCEYCQRVPKGAELLFALEVA